MLKVTIQALEDNDSYYVPPEVVDVEFHLEDERITLTTGKGLTKKILYFKPEDFLKVAKFLSTQE